ncbi:MAG: Mur ligase family protein [Patescibacteria group bacterium]
MNLDLTKIKKVFFLGVGGIGISAIARMFLLEGKEVLGSDISKNEVMMELKNLGAKMFMGQDLSFIPADIDLIIYTIAIPRYDLKFFEELNNVFHIPVVSYPQMLGIVTKNKYTIAVSGTHGKTTTTAMIAKVLVDLGRDPSVIVGSFLKDYKSNFIAGKSEFFVVEACEYERSFLNIHPKVLVITNIEADHLDYYKDLADIQNAFKEMMLQTDGVVIYNEEDEHVKEIVEEYTGNKISYGSYIEELPKLSVPGIHNRKNAACALALADALSLNKEDAKNSLQNFLGTWRRLDRKGETKEGTIVYDDYAHHPTEIQASIQGLRELYPVGTKKITIIFQPHLYSRTKALFDDFVKSFKGADQILLLPIYFAREQNDPTVSSEKLAMAMCMEGENVQAFPDFASAEAAVSALNLGSSDVLVTMGAGEAYKIGDKLLVKV